MEQSFEIAAVAIIIKDSRQVFASLSVLAPWLAVSMVSWEPEVLGQMVLFCGGGGDCSVAK